MGQVGWRAGACQVQGSRDIPERSPEQERGCARKDWQFIGVSWGGKWGCRVCRAEGIPHGEKHRQAQSPRLGQPLRCAELRTSHRSVSSLTCPDLGLHLAEETVLGNSSPLRPVV